MVKYVEIDGSMLDDVFDLVSLFNNPDVDRNRWSSALNPAWCDGRFPSGLGVQVDGKLEAFIGTLFSQRQIEGRETTVCNVHSLIVAPGSQASAARLILRLLKMKEINFVVNTPSRAVRDFLPGIGFISLRDRVQVLPTTGLGLLTRRDERSAAAVYHDKGIPADVLSAADRVIIDHHADTLCQHLALSVGGETCLVSYVPVARPTPHVMVLRVGDPAIFLDYHDVVRTELRDHCDVRSIFVDRRLIADQAVPLSYQLPFDARRYCLRAAGSPPPRSIDNLYSEFPLLGVPSVPNGVDELRQVVRPRIDRTVQKGRATVTNGRGRSVTEWPRRVVKSTVRLGLDRLA